jgi:hypothetical protein
MRRVVLVALCLAAAGCGDEAPAVECDAADGVVLNDVFYLAEDMDPPRPPAGRRLEGGTRPDCYGGGRAIALHAVRGLPPDVAVYRDGSIAGIYVNRRYFVFLGDRDHPPPRPFDTLTCTFDGTVVRTHPLRVRTARRTWRVRVDADTRFARFDSSIPYLAKGDRVRVRGHACRGNGMVPVRIEPLP